MRDLQGLLSASANPRLADAAEQGLIVRQAECTKFIQFLTFYTCQWAEDRIPGEENTVRVPGNLIGINKYISILPELHQRHTDTVFP